MAVFLRSLGIAWSGSKFATVGEKDALLRQVVPERQRDLDLAGLDAGQLGADGAHQRLTFAASSPQAS